MFCVRRLFEFWVFVECVCVCVSEETRVKSSSGKSFPLSTLFASVCSSFITCKMFVVKLVKIL